jgi:hypothetical protein
VSLTLLGAEATRARLAAVPPKLRTELRRNFRQVAGPIVNDMRNRASWSSRIPGAISVQSKFGERSAGVFIRVDSHKAPHARPYEVGQGRGNTFRHPVFGGPAWVTQQTRPFFFVAAKAHRAEVVAAAQAALRIATE